MKHRANISRNGTDPLKNKKLPVVHSDTNSLDCVFVVVQSAHTLSGFVETAVGMHDSVLDEVDAGVREDNGIEGCRDQPGGHRRGLVTRSFLLTQEAGWSERWIHAWLCPLPAWLLDQASKLQIGRANIAQGSSGD